MDDNIIAVRMARTLAGLALIQRTLKGDKPPIEKKIVCKVSMSKMTDGGDPEINMLVIPVIMGYIIDVVSKQMSSSIKRTPLLNYIKKAECISTRKTLKIIYWGGIATPFIFFFFFCS